MKHSHTRVLVVEDDPSWQQVLREILTDLDLVVDITANLEAAVTMIRDTPHRLAVVDLSLDKANHRNQDGLKVLEALHSYDPGCAAVLLTGYATVEIAVNALTTYGVLTCLRKERFIRRDFRELINQALAKPSPWSDPQPEPDQRSSAHEETLNSVSEAEETTNSLALVVEDDAGWRSLLAELLSESGYQVRECSGYGDALGHIGRERYALAVIDLSLTQRTGVSAPGSNSSEELSGYHLLSSTRASGIPTIVVSGIASPDIIERIYEGYGIFSYLEKQTFDRSAFLQTIAEIQEQHVIAAELSALTSREYQVFSLLATGMTNQEIADTLVISTNTVKRHLKAIYKKLEIHSRAAAVAIAINAGLSTG